MVYIILSICSMSYLYASHDRELSMENPYREGFSTYEMFLYIGIILLSISCILTIPIYKKATIKSVKSTVIILNCLLCLNLVNVLNFKKVDLILETIQIEESIKYYKYYLENPDKRDDLHWKHSSSQHLSIMLEGCLKRKKELDTILNQK